ncbi:D-aminoacyl-tRNA deacylase [Dichelobacter nodosus]|uniref:D-aminoacyl-tRNA deacylase n=1 Tax=Dichelobacter nodosus (strain VCS1703A) TaxID=246195 RepID=DTD_DICNV|nr:D-aminoacyl-tRNA deacylase [Dichelobacter nodosus]A5EVP7.1 RecName: Full=D-aminoacyl-tRNA deacylase; Short=DTD; AltName: Full=Gly-tRNA(Ala) deacylase [Dichelobacter nodosus VCS1703A]ABQ13834.1 D-tyrosyl-tRNA deacylase [Dichelobacter nodosus VCS1703A]AXM45375.1 D-tyrosyl-tRNA(Tyr) deacylase [Dichelobacter nodosus]KNZ39393.1 D-tyrosyl-tRNA(Tyr) deacylase [Dichelobacter nodosus]TGA65014.1 D-tyrosyl-tRNA(Tyr) deacylase [Dichelobacter nodosus]
MIGLIQRVERASVCVEGKEIGAIDRGLLVFVGIERADSAQQAEKLAQKLLNYRVFEDELGKMNLNVQQIGGELLLVSQFTLAANTQKGNRPSFDPAMAPQEAEPLFDYFCQTVHTHYPHTATGRFGADMRVHLINDGPVTFWLHV